MIRFSSIAGGPEHAEGSVGRIALSYGDPIPGHDGTKKNLSEVELYALILEKGSITTPPANAKEFRFLGSKTPKSNESFPSAFRLRYEAWIHNQPDTDEGKAAMVAEIALRMIEDASVRRIKQSPLTYDPASDLAYLSAWCNFKGISPPSGTE